MSTRIFRTAVLLGAGAFALGALPNIAAAQEAPPQEQTTPQQQPTAKAGRHMHGDKMLEGLNLTDDQQAQIKKIHEDAKAKADAIKADSSLSDPDKQTKIREIHRASMKQVRDVLTPEQRQQLRAKMKERRNARQTQQPS